MALPTGALGTRGYAQIPSIQLPKTPPVRVRLLAVVRDLLKRSPTPGLAAALPLAAAICLVLSFAGVVGLGGLYRSQLDWVRHTEEVQAELAHVFSLLQDAELGQRGFLLTREQAYDDRIQTSRVQFYAAFASLRELTKDNAVQAGSLDRLSELAKRRFDSNLEDLSRAQAGETVRHLQPLDDVRNLIDLEQRRENDLLKERVATASATSGWLMSAAMLSLVMAALSLALWLRDRHASSISALETKNALVSLAVARGKIEGETAARESVEGQVRQLQKMEAVGQLTGGIAHDFNNMNAVVMSAISLCRKRLARGETDIASLLDAAMDAAQRSAALTARLLAFSRLQQLSPEVLDPSQFISSMTDLLRRTLGENISIETVLGGGLWRTNADASQLENVILNLCVNARDAMPGGGKLTLETANVSLDDAYARANVDVVPGQYVMIAVTDNGEGMPPEVVARAFEPFFTTKPVGAGSGLGLSQVFGFVKQSGGNVNIYSEPGKGTTIKIYLPRFVGDDKAVLEAEPHTLIPRGNADEIILVVEDERRLREVTVAGLRELGYTIIHADGGANALLKLEQHPEIGCLFTDMIMPGMTGRQLADEATRRWPGLKVLFTTGYARESVVHNRTLAKSANFLPKPYTLDDLALKMRTVLEGPVSAPAP